MQSFFYRILCLTSLSLNYQYTAAPASMLRGLDKHKNVARDARALRSNEMCGRFFKATFAHLAQYSGYPFLLHFCACRPLAPSTLQIARKGYGVLSSFAAIFLAHSYPIAWLSLGLFFCAHHFSINHTIS